MFLIHYTILDGEYEYTSIFLHETDDLHSVLSRIVSIGDDDIDGMIREYESEGSIAIDNGQRAIQEVRIEKVPQHLVKCLTQFL